MSVRASFATAWRSLWRGKTLWVLLAAVVAVQFMFPGLVRSDGTAVGRLEMHVRMVFGAVAAIAYVSSLALSCGSFSRDREDNLLHLSLVRPASAFSIAAGRWLAIVALMAIVFVFNAFLLNVKLLASQYAPGDCRTYHAPSLPPVEVSAARMMDEFLKSDRTPEAVKKAPRAAVLALLASKENERYEVVAPGKTVSLPFSVSAREPVEVRVRFSTLYNIKESLSGEFRYRGCAGTVSNSTQAVLSVPLSRVASGNLRFGEMPSIDPKDLELTFRNDGNTDVMFRPRRDVELLTPGDSFVANSARATAETIALAGLLAAFGLFLSAALSRPVALFVAAVLLAASLMAPDAVSQFPDEFNATFGERAGLAVSRIVTRFTSAFSEMSPVSSLASGRAISMAEVAKTAFSDLVVLPAAFLALAAFVLRRKA